MQQNVCKKLSTTIEDRSIGKVSFNYETKLDGNWERFETI